MGCIGGLARGGAVLFRHLGNLLDVGGDVVARRALFLQRDGNLVHRRNHALGAATDAEHRIARLPRHADALLDPRHRLLHGAHRRLCAGLHGDNHAADLGGGLRRALGQLAHFVGHHGKAAALLAGARRFDGGIQSQQVGLIGHVLDDLDDAGDLLRVLSHGLDSPGGFAHGLGYLLHFGHRVLNDTVAFLRQAAGLGGDAVGLAGAVGDMVDAHRHLFHRSRHGGGGFGLVRRGGGDLG